LARTRFLRFNEMTLCKALALPSFANALVACIVMLTIAAGLGGCASLLKWKSETGPDISTTAKNDGLIKPKIADTAGSASDALPDSKESSIPVEFDTSKRGLEPSASPLPVSRKESPHGTPRPPSPQAKHTEEKQEQRGREIVSGGTRTDGNPAGSIAAPGIGKSARAEKPDTKATASSGPQFEKHDHSRYVKKLRRKGIELVNKSRTSFYARICRDHISEEWTLTIYEKSRGRFWFTKHVWDHIDERWEESFKSQKQRMSKFKRHVKFASAGKECRTMKGRIEQ
jgi:hypothetical protein